MSETAVVVLGFVLPCLMTTLGAVLVFFFKRTSKIVNMITIGLAAGIMLSASIWSLLVPALENAREEWGDFTFVPVVLGFVLGGLLMLLMDFVSNRLYREKEGKKCHSDGSGADGRISASRETGSFGPLASRDVSTSAQRAYAQHDNTCRNDRNGGARDDRKKETGEECENGARVRKKAFKMFTAITIHNIPEGLSVGFAIGTAVALHTPLLAALMFALGIALQNFPEGLATALPLYASLGKKGKAFWLATLSGLVEPVFAIAGYFLAAYITSLLPWLLAFAAGAMIYVIVEEMIPEIQSDHNKKWGVWAFVIGFVVMMVLDICL